MGLGTIYTSGDLEIFLSEYERVQAAAEYSPIISNQCTQINLPSPKKAEIRKYLAPMFHKNCLKLGTLNLKKAKVNFKLVSNYPGTF